MYYAIRHTTIPLLHYLIAVKTHNNFVKECVGGNSASDVEKQDVDDGNDGI